MESFNKAKLKNIRGRFEEKTGVDLGEKSSRYHRKKEKQYGRYTFRRGAVIALVAVLLLSMGVVAYAVGTTNLLSTYFAAHSGGELSETQQQFLVENAVGIGQSQTADGYTVTIDSAVCDEHTVYITMRIVAPEGVIIDFENRSDGIPEGTLFFKDFGLVTTGSDTQTGSILSWSASWSNISDGDGKGNTATIVLQVANVTTEDSNIIYTDGEIWRLGLGQLSTNTGEYWEIRTVLTEAEWNFAFLLTDLGGEVEIISEPVICEANTAGLGDAEEYEEVFITSFALRPFGATLRYRYIPSTRPESVEIMDVYLVMKDGSTIIAYPKSGGGHGSTGGTGDEILYLFNAPVIIDEVNYIVLPNDVHIEMPKSEQ